MMKKETVYYILFVLLLFGLFYFLEKGKKEPMDWRQTYTKSDKIPYGAKALFDLWSASKEKPLEVKDQTVYEVLHNQADTNVAYFFMDRSIYFSQEDLDELNRLMLHGGKVFVATAELSLQAMDYFHVKMIENYNYYGEEKSKSKNQECFYFGPKETSFCLEQNSLGRCIEVDSVNQVTSLLRDKQDQAIAIKKRIGKGDLIWVVWPEMFSNYLLSNDRVRPAVYHLLGHLEGKKVYWDEYYKQLKDRKQPHPLHILLESKALKPAWFIFLGALAIFILFQVKRKQRMIPVIQAPTNQTLNFVEVVSNVYFSSGNHRFIVEERIRYFNDYVRGKYFISDVLKDKDFYAKLAALSGIPEEDVRRVYGFIQSVEGKERISNEELLVLNQLIDDFITKSKR